MKRRILSLCLAVGLLPLTAQAYDAPRTVCETPCRHCANVTVRRFCRRNRMGTVSGKLSAACR